MSFSSYNLVLLVEHGVAERGLYHHYVLAARVCLSECFAYVPYATMASNIWMVHLYIWLGQHIACHAGSEINRAIRLYRIIVNAKYVFVKWMSTLNLNIYRQSVRLYNMLCFTSSWTVININRSIVASSQQLRIEKSEQPRSKIPNIIRFAQA